MSASRFALMSVLLAVGVPAAAVAQQLGPDRRLGGQATGAGFDGRVVWVTDDSLVLVGPDTVTVRAVPSAPAADRLTDSAGWGAPQITLATGQGTASVWLLRAADSVYLVAAIPDSTFYWGDDLVVSLDTEGDRAEAPGHDDFQWYLRRVLDSSVVYRGRAGRWDAPQGDPDWRLGPHRGGPGWDALAVERTDGRGWTAVLRLDAGWLELAPGRPGLALRMYDNAPGGWHAWPTAPAPMQATRVEGRPDLWGVIIPTGRAESSGAAPPGGPGTRP